MKHTATIDSLVWIDPEAVPPWHRDTMFNRMTVRSTYDGDEDVEIKTWEERNGRIGLPLTYGMRIAEYLNLEIEDNRTRGKRVIFLKRPTPRDSKQAMFFDSLTESAKANSAVMAVAATGVGKTVAALQSLANLGRTALVVVPTRSLAQQWKQEAIKHLGCAPKSIHIFESGKCKWVNFKLVIAVIHNLCNKELPPDFCKYFGTVIWDEAHRVGATVFSQSIKKFPARYRIALTATPIRRDGRTAILTQTFGTPCGGVKGNDLKPMPCTAYVVNTTCKVTAPLWGNKITRLAQTLSALTKNESRNILIASIIARGYSAGRNILILSDRIEHLKELMSLVCDIGVPVKTCGLFIGSTNKSEVARIKEDIQIIFATYGMMKEGQDIPRLDMGIDASPRSEGVQAIGRVRRIHPGKKHPIWVTLFDTNGSDIIKGISKSRIKDYKACGVGVVNVGKKLSSITM